MSDGFRDRLRALPDFPAYLPDFDPATAALNFYWPQHVRHRCGPDGIQPGRVS